MTSMIGKGTPKTEEHLINQIKRRNHDTANFALFIGAGASANSGVKLAKEMIDEWRLQLYKQAHSKKSLEDWLSEQEWFSDQEEYSLLFEEVYDQAPQRRNYIEDCIKEASPSWGYIYLANILANNYFNVVFTPNFDDLLNEACFLYTNCRPIVCAHDSAVSSIRVTLKRQKIIKLHGDFLYDNIKNTRIETENLEKNMRDKFSQCAHEYGLVVIGYGGNDRSIMDNLEILLRTDGCFPHGVYWCLRKDGKVSRSLARFLERPRVYKVEIEGFDDFMAKLHDGLGLTLPDIVKNPYQATTDKLNKFTEQRPANKIIQRDIVNLTNQVNMIKEKFSHAEPSQESLVPYRFLGISALNNGEIEKAIDNLENAIKQEPKDYFIQLILGYAYIIANQLEESRAIAQRLKTTSPPNYYALRYASALYRFFDVNESLHLRDLQLEIAKNDEQKVSSLVSKANDLIKLEKYGEALSLIEAASKINPKDPVVTLNKALCLKKIGRFKEVETQLREILLSMEDHYYKAGIYALINDKNNMIVSFKQAIMQNRAAAIVAGFVDPAFDEYKQDPEFKKLLSLELTEKPEKK